MRLKNSLFLLLIMTNVSCFKTIINTGLEPREEVFEQRQWFLLNGDIPLTDPIGEECTETGLAYSESGKEAEDLLIGAGLYLSGYFIGSTFFCNSDDSIAQTSCSNGFATAFPWIVGSRTVRFQCVDNNSTKENNEDNSSEN